MILKHGDMAYGPGGQQFVWDGEIKTWRTLEDWELVDKNVEKIWDEKPTNPKDMIGSNKLPMSLFPKTAVAYGCLGFLEGMLKYGLTNWREAGIRISIYLDAAERHHAKFQNGEWADHDTHVPHLASILACYAIIVDAHTCGKLIDDRPKQAPVGELLKILEPVVPHLKELFIDKNPKHWIHEPEEE